MLKHVDPVSGAAPLTLPRTAIVIWAAASLGLVAVNAFGIVTEFGPTGASFFWSGLIGINMAGWFAWRRAVPDDDHRWARLMLGAVLLNGLLAVEVPLLYHLLGRQNMPLDWRPTAYGLVATAFIVFLLQQARARRGTPAEAADSSAVVTPATPVAILTRAGIADVEELLWVRAEDHYCRLGIRGRDTLLIHYRFRDAVDDLRGSAGAQVHRSAWVADHAVVDARRSGRRWSLRLTDGSSVRVSESSIALCRARGWSGMDDGSA